MKEKKKIGIWNEEELQEIRNLIQKSRELDEKRDMGRVFLSRAIGAFYGPKRSVQILRAIIEGSEDVIYTIYDILIDDIVEVEHSLNLTGEESVEELWKIATILSTIANTSIDGLKIESNDKVFNKVYVLGRIAFMLHLIKKRGNKKDGVENLLPHRGRRVTIPNPNQEFVDNILFGCSSCKHRPIEPCEHSKMCSHCEPVGNDAIGSNWEPMSVVERAERLSYYNEECDYSDIEETVVDSLLSLMESHGGYLPPLADEEFWAMGPESE